MDHHIVSQRKAALTVLIPLSKNTHQIVVMATPLESEIGFFFFFKLHSIPSYLIFHGNRLFLKFKNVREAVQFWPPEKHRSE